MDDIITEDDIRGMVEDCCEFTEKDHGIGSYEYGDGKYIDVCVGLYLTPDKIKVSYCIDPENMILMLVRGTYTRDGRECDYIVELDSVDYNIKTKEWDVTYEVYED
jgi:hypothetical protein